MKRQLLCPDFSWLNDSQEPNGESQDEWMSLMNTVCRAFQKEVVLAVDLVIYYSMRNTDPAIASFLRGPQSVLLAGVQFPLMVSQSFVPGCGLWGHLWVRTTAAYRRKYMEQVWKYSTEKEAASKPFNCSNYQLDMNCNVPFGRLPKELVSSHFKITRINMEQQRIHKILP